MNGLEITKQDFLKLNTDDKMVVLYDNVVDMRRDIKALKKRKWWNTTASFMGGVGGGVLAALGLKIGR